MGNCLCKVLRHEAPTHSRRGAAAAPPGTDAAHAGAAAAASKAPPAVKPAGGGAKAVGVGDVVLEEGQAGSWRIAAKVDPGSSPPAVGGGAPPSSPAAQPEPLREAQREGSRQAQQATHQKDKQQSPQQAIQQTSQEKTSQKQQQQTQPQAQPPPSKQHAAGPGSPSSPSRGANATTTRRVDRRFRDCYRVGETLGKGGFAVVKRVTERSTGRPYAVKIMSLPPVGVEPGDNESTREDIAKEIDILCGLDHPNVVGMKEWFEEGGKVYLITELVGGGELLEAVIRRGAYGEAEARGCFASLMAGIAYLHSRNVAHRDLKLENLLLATPDDITQVKIADFGLAKRSPGGAMSTVCGTPQYVAPEVIAGTPGVVYGPQVDMWSAGVVLFILLCGYPPFYAESEPALFDQIRRGAYGFDDPAWDAVTPAAKDLISRLLAVDPAARPTASECLGHPWLRGGGEGGGPGTGAGGQLPGAQGRLRQAYAASLRGESFAAAMAAGREAEAAAARGGAGDGVP
ncbi:hypothetical protein Rsub_10881 [Raphidocelis subcapitata]|uniref:Protein kinase domain-containing protein n=1 Tax=Raphidocelis subcapitata TaxID=307507 RepID=A0A2V0PK70_9CHLO|nr:hypothetical protein Rsub_10881 [Raphidocelis subcapitata]|eukprot:GBF97717.1 hypothetical protein Rsub_10881 [Raphidocelis subcapitata]